MKRIFSFTLFVAILMMSAINVKSQTLIIDENGVAINEDESGAALSAILDVKSTDKGILVPRMTTVQIAAIATPEIGLLVYDTDINKFKYYSVPIWKEISYNGNIAQATTEGEFLTWDSANNMWKVSSDIYSVNGNVGIGTEAPNEKLHVYNSTAGGYAAKFQTPYGHLIIGAANSTYMHFYTDRPTFIFDKTVMSKPGIFSSYLNKNIYLKTFNDTRLSILHTNGNVGIGTTTPTEKLEVAGSVKADTFLLADGTLLSGGGKFVDGTIPTDAVYTAGNVGIGTSMPNAPLHIYKEGDGAAAMFETSNGYIRMGAANQYYAHFYTNMGAFFFEKNITLGEGRITAYSSKNLDFWTGGDFRMRILPTNGNVGIGTTAPTEKLEVAGSVKADTFLLADGTPLTGGGKFVDGTTISDAVFTGGNVGIGTAAPTEKLEVNGNIKVESLKLGNGARLLPYSDEDVWLHHTNPYSFMQFVLGTAHSWDNSLSFLYTPGVVGAKLGSLKIGQLHKNDLNFTHGTTVFYTAGIERLRINNTGKVGIGTSEPNNLIQVKNLLQFHPTNYSVHLGEDAGKVNTGDYNVFTGKAAGYSNTTGSKNLFLGYQSGYGNTTGGANVFIGYKAGYNETGSNKLYIANNVDSKPLIHGDFENNEVGVGTHAREGYTLNVGGTAISAKWLTNSDVRWKQNIVEITGAVNIVKQMRGVRYDWKVSEFPNNAFEQGTQVGLIAQEVEALVPEIVYTDPDGYKSVAYDKLVSVLLQAIKEQQVVIEQLQLDVQEIIDNQE